MRSGYVDELSLRRHAIKRAWQRTLRHEPVTGPLSNPDTLVLLIDRTLDDLLAALAARAAGVETSPAQTRNLRTGCVCGLNPLLAYFRVGASVIASVLGAGGGSALDNDARADCRNEVLGELQVIAHREIRSFCAMCQTEIARNHRLADCRA